ncbi:MAG TPA: glycosyltransferase family protein [Sphingobacteriaceae bacterium]
MRILYAIQGTGNGHISRAREIVPLLQQHGHVDLLISGTQADVNLSQPVTYRFHGFSFIFGKKGGVDHWKTYRTMDLSRLRRDIKSIPLKNYDLIINDFEPVTGWACKLQGIPSVSLSHQASFLSQKTPRPQNGFHWAELVFRHYAPATHHIGFHFDRYDSFIHTPVIRSDIRNQETKDLGHITVYLPAFDDRLLLTHLKKVPDVRWEVFSKHARRSYTDTNVRVYPVNNEQYNQSLAHSHGLLTGGGFEGPAEALYLGKKVMVIPMKNQYEQLCNAEAVKRLGVPVVHQLDARFVPALKQWLSDPVRVKAVFPDETSAIVDNMVRNFVA